MTSEQSERTVSYLPFMFRFAQPLPPVPRHVLRYDRTRQMSQVLVDGRWIDSPDASDEPTASTRITRVSGETTDDE